MNKLDVLYICDDMFAEVAGVSLTSLFENNPKDRISLCVYVLVVGLSRENEAKFISMGRKYGHQLKLIDASEEFEEIKSLRLDSYRGSVMTNLRLHFDKLVPETVRRLLYIDCDTIICGALTDIAQMPLNGGLLAMAYDAYGRMLTDAADVPYYNAGVLLIDCNRWRREGWRSRIENFITDNTQHLAHPDQDVLNVVCKDEITPLPIRYNFQVIHREYPEELYFRYLAPNWYYSAQEIREARENPCILHMIRSLGTNPWYSDGSSHPDYVIYERYKKMSFWKESSPQSLSPGFVIRCERGLKKALPMRVFFPVSIAAMRIAADRA